jgi:hypothetical protein
VLPYKVYWDMVEAGGITPTDDPARFTINFSIVKQQFPQWMEHMVLQTLNETEQWAYLNGYVMYQVVDGLLAWKSTGKLL